MSAVPKIELYTLSADSVIQCFGAFRFFYGVSVIEHIVGLSEIDENSSRCAKRTDLGVLQKQVRIVNMPIITPLPVPVIERRTGIRRLYSLIRRSGIKCIKALYSLLFALTNPPIIV